MTEPSDDKKRRSYNSPVRRKQTLETQQRIIDAGVELVREFPSWDWRNLTFKAVGERAGISERTVYRYFANEGLLRDAVINKTIQESGVDLDNISFANFVDNIAKMFASLASFSARTGAVEDPKFISIDQQRRNSLERTVQSEIPQWSKENQAAVAAVLDLLWNPATYERLVQAWGLDNNKATSAIAWLAKLVEQAVADDNKPLGDEPAEE
ncbi:TetR/AcrR family transcriptional regulator [Halioxenophilus sp. WMMB6]|uniref:TetR/AcrR family transcriptional regulator n=1 Tax=Halioxenophilus sp. WMMB6 TaxID=3073815 RepID=UPI00295E3F6D|nr:TetR/AcrR family transcriptional regulator [Halioxenophilus sp. WMMB6]